MQCQLSTHAFFFFLFFIESLPAFLKSRQGSILTILAWVQAERGSLQHCGVLADVPDVEVYKDRDRGEGGHSEPSQHEDVCQHDKLQGKTKEHGLLWRLLVQLTLSAAWALAASFAFIFACKAFWKEVTGDANWPV